ncbi:MAG: hypothetical protein EBE86_018720 [Hormoscilla sp. GUM202]|nr:hypothetical protein [Hormoscilla sp. GUM202]
MSELEKGDRNLIIPIHFLSLMGFLVFYGMQRFTWKYSSGQQETWIFYIQLFFASLYNFLLVYATPSQFKESLPFAILYVVAMGLSCRASKLHVGAEGKIEATHDSCPRAPTHPHGWVGVSGHDRRAFQL